jgi:hypothetical protein
MGDVLKLNTWADQKKGKALMPRPPREERKDRS